MSHNTAVSISKDEEDSGSKNQHENRKNKQTSVIIGDSIGKEAYGQKLSKGLQNKHHVIVRFFGDAKTQCMKDYLKPTINQSPYRIIPHFGTNNLPAEESPESIAGKIVKLAKKAKTKTNLVSISEIISHTFLLGKIY